MSEQDREGEVVSLADGRARAEAREAEVRRQQAREQAKVEAGQPRPAPWLTYVLIGLNALVWVVMVSLGVDPYEPSTDALIEFGGNFGIRTSNGQWWRLLTSMFLHGGIYHIGFNLYFMWVIGRLSEQIYGPSAYAVIYFASGMLASMLSVAWEPAAVSVGASGALFGVFGALMGFTIRRRGVLPQAFVVSVKRNALMLIGLNAVVAVVVPGIDIAAHVGGLVAGVGLGYLISQLAERPVSTPAEAKRVRVRALAVACAGTIAVLAAGGTALHLQDWDDPTDALSNAYDRAVAAEIAYNESAGDLAKRLVVLEQQAIPAMHECSTELATLERLPKRARERVDMWSRYCDLAGQAFAKDLEGLRNGDDATLEQAAALYSQAAAALEPEE
ncbi:rhomboid family serine protease [Enhygromyxa salina]|uniref:Rhomboid family serine protease n=1 Tax=Enhygromyxa salina TaxID=215803 RepID=A0A0C2DGI8_9BACT|nr:rhomboid family intramembrane serine protease [Enhygromyxa salina]KIG18787.1 rhomboid family serine protease [Enhygromyxa salina]